MRADRKAQAAAHYNRMKKEYEKEIADAINNSIIYKEHSEAKFQTEAVQIKPLEQSIYVVPIDSVTACFEYKEGKTALLNFASFKNPGGGFLNGSIAQEEALCHASFLYNVLENFMSYYEENRKDVNRGMYQDRALYSPEIRFFLKEQSITAGVITCAAPNYSVSLNSGSFTKEENTNALDSRIKLILSIAADNEIETLILGAFGCGVFRQDAREMAVLFKKWLQEVLCFKKVVFAIPTINAVSAKNYHAFQQVFS